MFQVFIYSFKNYRYRATFAATLCTIGLLTYHCNVAAINIRIFHFSDSLLTPSLSYSHWKCVDNIAAHRPEATDGDVENIGKNSVETNKHTQYVDQVIVDKILHNNIVSDQLTIRYAHKTYSHSYTHHTHTQTHTTTHTHTHKDKLTIKHRHTHT